MAVACHPGWSGADCIGIRPLVEERRNDAKTEFPSDSSGIPQAVLKHPAARSFTPLITQPDISGSFDFEANRKGTIMPLVDIQVIEGVFTADQKKEMIEKVTDTMVEIEGETLRGVTWVRVQEVASGDWRIGGKALTAADVKALQGSSA